MSDVHRFKSNGIRLTKPYVSYTFELPEGVGYEVIGDIIREIWGEEAYREFIIQATIEGLRKELIT